MIFYLSKILWFFFNPINLIIIFLFLGFIAKIFNFKKINNFLNFVSILIFIISGVLPTGSYLNYLLEKNFHSLEKNIKNVNGVLILSGATNPYLSKIHDQVNFNDSVERLTESILLINKHLNAKIIFAGGSGSLGNIKLTHADVAKKFFMDMGVDIGRINFEKKSRNTYENILYSKDIAKPTKDEKWLLVTSAFHLKRSMAVAKKLDWDFVPYPTDFKSDKNFQWSLIQSFNFLSNLSVFQKASHEWTGIIFYALMGRL